MSVSIKSEHEIELMRHAGHLLEKVHNELASHIRPGISTKELDKIGEDLGVQIKMQHEEIFDIMHRI